MRNFGFDLEIQEWEHVIAIVDRLKRDIPLLYNLYKACTDDWHGARHPGPTIPTNTHQAQAIGLFRQIVSELASKFDLGLIIMLRLAVITAEQILWIDTSVRLGEASCDLESKYRPGGRIHFRHCGKRSRDLTPNGPFFQLLGVAQDVIKARLGDRKVESESFITKPL